MNVVYCNVDSSVPLGCPRADNNAQFISANLSIIAGISQALNEYSYLSESDPTDGSIQWRSAPSDSADRRRNPERDPVTNEMVESALEFWQRNAAAVQTYKDTVDVGGRNYTAPSVSLSDIQNDPFYYDNLLFTLNTAAFFNRNTNEFSPNFSAANAHIILMFDAPEGGSTWATNSCN